ncbi:MAG: hypothetical protein GXO25_06315 [Euryarchaeota archaeon]|nr:hypothetical protein [Euryarchaeota archaeon]
MLSKIVKFFIFLLAMILIVYPFTLQMGVREGTLNDALEVSAITPAPRIIKNASWIESVDTLSTLNFWKNYSLTFNHFDLTSLTLFGNSSVGKYIPLSSGRFFKSSREAVIGMNLLNDMLAAGFDVGINKYLHLSLEKNETVIKNITVKIVGIMPASIGHLGTSLILPYSLVNSKYLYLTEYLIVPKKGYTKYAVEDYLSSMGVQVITSTRALDVFMFNMYFNLLGAFTVLVGFVLFLIAYELDMDRLFQEYAIIEIAGGSTKRYLMRRLEKDIIFTITAYGAAIILLILLTPFIYGYLNSIFTHLLFIWSFDIRALGITAIICAILIVYQYILLRYYAAKFSLSEFMRRGWKM